MKKFALFFISWFLFAQASYASVIVMGTRFVFPAQQREISINLNNESKKPALLQVWFDAGDANSRGENLPFNALPPLFKMKPNSAQTLRVVKTPHNFAKDRESIFYINILEIPPKPKMDKNRPYNYLQFAIRSRFKLFYRPKLSMARNIAEKNIVWKLVKKGNKTLVQAKNNTPYFITLADVVFKYKNKEYKYKNPNMFKPFSINYIEFDKFNISTKAKGKFVFKSINDYGGKTEFSYSN